MERKQAERVNRTKKSGLRQRYQFKLSSSINSCLLDLQMKWLFWRAESRHHKIFKKHCKKGFHMLQRTVQERATKQKMKVEYLECKFCNYVFFSTIKDKNKWKMLNSKKRNTFRKLKYEEVV